MTIRAVFLADGPSDLPLTTHLEALCAERHREVQVTAVDPRNIREGGRTVQARLRFLTRQGIDPDLVFVHRDAERQDPEDRIAEIRAGAAAVGIADGTVVPVVPVRMTEAWLLLDEAAIRRVADRPSSTNDLGLPPLRVVESVADPKALLAEALLKAGAPSGRRRLRQFQRDFGRHRALLVQRLDRNGPVSSLSAWQRLRTDIATALDRLDNQGPPP